MQVWTVANQKGGVGKTTTSVSLAGLLSQRGKKVLMIDMDPHGSMTTYFGLDPDNVEGGVYTLFTTLGGNSMPEKKILIRNTAFADLDLMPASAALATLDRQLGARPGMGLILKTALDKLSHEYEYVIIDCPPSLGILMINALVACEKLLIPVQTEFLAIKGLERILHTIDMIMHSLSSPLEYIIIPTMFDKRTRASHEALDMLQQKYEYNLWGNVVPVDTQFRDASLKGQPISYMKPNSRGTVAYKMLLESLFAHGHEHTGKVVGVFP
ncbi:MAG: ParA family protein [Gammaproteobacteria bacterium]|nr:MAG: ParA family protein [Gammaproteobacteria bacterium]